MEKIKYQRYLEGYQLVVQLENDFDAIAKRYGITFNQYLILKQIIENNCDEPSLLAYAFGVSRPAMSRKLTVLFRNGKITKLYNLNGEDQRITSLRATDEGRANVAALNREYEMMLAPYSKSSDALMAQFLEILKRILKDN